MNLEAAAREHCTLFNASVRNGDWAPFIATFTPDAHMEFVNVPVGRSTDVKPSPSRTRRSHPTTPW